MDEVEELRAAHARAVAGADAERCRIERALHDGPQQHLVALCMRLQLARGLADSDPVGLSALLDELERDTHGTLEEIRLLGSRVYPPLLAGLGLREALRAAAADAAVSTRVDARLLERYPQRIEETVYFCCLEVLRRAEEAGLERVLISVREEAGDLRFTVTVDGASVDPGTSWHASPVGDRLRAVGGSLSATTGAGRVEIAGSIALPG